MEAGPAGEKAKGTIGKRVHLISVMATNIHEFMINVREDLDLSVYKA